MYVKCKEGSVELPTSQNPKGVQETYKKLVDAKGLNRAEFLKVKRTQKTLTIYFKIYNMHETSR